MLSSSSGMYSTALEWAAVGSNSQMTGRRMHRIDLRRHGPYIRVKVFDSRDMDRLFRMAHAFYKPGKWYAGFRADDRIGGVDDLQVIGSNSQMTGRRMHRIDLRRHGPYIRVKVFNCRNVDRFL